MRGRGNALVIEEDSIEGIVAHRDEAARLSARVGGELGEEKEEDNWY